MPDYLHLSELHINIIDKETLNDMKKFIDFFHIRYINFGKIPLCNLNEQHGFKIGNFCFPLCVRCSAIFFSVIIIFVLIKFFDKQFNIKQVLFISMLHVPCIVDGILQSFFGIESNVFRRSTTGILCGISFAVTISYCAEKIYRIFFSENRNSLMIKKR